MEKDSSGSVVSIRPVFLALLAAIGALVAYSASCMNGFSFDDFLLIVRNPWISQNSLLSAFFSKDYFHYTGEGTYRPGGTLFYFIIIKCFGADPFFLHLASVLIHALVSALVVVLARRLGLDRGALWAGCAFAVHPMLTEAVCCVGFVRDELIALFAMIFMLVVTRKEAIRPVDLFFAGISAMLACLVKESGVVIIALTAAWFALMRPAERTRREMVLCLAVAGVVFSGYIILRFVYMRGLTFILHPIGDNMFQTAASTAVIFLKYVGRMFLPLTLSVDRVPVTFADLPVLLMVSAILVHVILLGGAVFLRKTLPLFSYGVLWFYFSLAPVSNIIPISNPEADRYLYLPAVGFFLALAALAQAIVRRYSRLMPVIACIAVILPMCWLYKTMLRVGDWYDNRTLWSSEYKINQRNDRALAELAVEANRGGNYLEAAELARRAVSLNASNGIALLQYGKALHMQNQPVEALGMYRRAVADNALFWQHRAHAWLCIGMILDDNFNKPDDAGAAYKSSLAINPYCLDASIRLGCVYISRGDIASALKTWKEALEKFPGNKILLNNIAIAEKAPNGG